MGVTRGIGIDFEDDVSLLDLIAVLQEAGWSLPERGVQHLPPDAGEDYDWQVSEIEEWPKVQEMIRQEEAKKGTVGVGLHWQGGDDAATFALLGCNQLIIVLNGFGPRLSEGSRFTDYTWYLQRILLPFVDKGYKVWYVHCSDDL